MSEKDDKVANGQSQSPKGPHFTSQRIFKAMSILVFIAIILSARGFWNFRQYCESKGYYVFHFDLLGYFLIGMVVAWAFRYGYYTLMRQNIMKIVHPKYEDEEREKKIRNLLKLSYDSLFYLSNTLVTLYLFREESWFPSWVGGEGSCDLIYEDFPNWPPNKRSQIEIYFLFHLGVHFFSMVELPLFRWTERKFYEWTLHHLVTVSLILFSLTCNEVTIGIAILFTHDASDVFLSSGRFYTEANIPRNTFLTILIGAAVVFAWIYFRLVAYPICMITQVYANTPTPDSQYYMIKYEYIFLLFMTCILLILHIFWTYFLLSSLFLGAKKKKLMNNYDVHKRQS